MKESFALVNQQRHGLFSQPGSLAIRENTFAQRNFLKETMMDEFQLNLLTF